MSSLRLAVVPPLLLAFGACASEQSPESGLEKNDGRVIYDGSYFLEADQVTAPEYTVWSQSVALLVPATNVVCSDDDPNCYVWVDTLNRAYRDQGGFCDDREGLADQVRAPTAATGFLVYDADPTGSRTMITAGHVLGSLTCSQTRVVFDFRFSSSSLRIPDDVDWIAVPTENVFACDQAIATALPNLEEENFVDYAAFTIRPFADGYGATYRAGACLSDLPGDRTQGTPVYSIGHVHGMSQKYVFGGQVLADVGRFESVAHDLASFTGLSGAFIMNGFNHWVIGIHSSGLADSLIRTTREDGSPCVTLARVPQAVLEDGTYKLATHVHRVKVALQAFYPRRNLACPTN